MSTFNLSYCYNHNHKHYLHHYYNNHHYNHHQHHNLRHLHPNNHHPGYLNQPINITFPPPQPPSYFYHNHHYYYDCHKHHHKHPHTHFYPFKHHHHQHHHHHQTITIITRPSPSSSPSLLPLSSPSPLPLYGNRGEKIDRRAEANLSRKEQTTVSRLKSGHHPNLKYWLHKIGRAVDRVCRKCDLGEETTEQIVYDCPRIHRPSLQPTPSDTLATGPQRVVRIWETWCSTSALPAVS